MQKRRGMPMRRLWPENADVATRVRSRMNDVVWGTHGVRWAALADVSIALKEGVQLSHLMRPIDRVWEDANA